MTAMRKTILVAVGVLAVTATAAAWSLRPRTQSASAGRAVRAPRVVAPGEIESVSDRIELSFETPGRVAEVRVEEGDHVLAGQVLARLDDRLSRARVAQADAALLAARARQTRAMRGARSEEIRTAEAELEMAAARAREQERARGRAEQLIASEAISAAELDRARDGDDAARAGASAAEARLAMLRSGERDETRREAMASVAAAEAELEQARALLAQTELRAPHAGVVLRRLVEPGEGVVTTPPTVALTLADIEHLRVRAEIDESDVGRVAVGQRGHATSDAFPGSRFPGRIVRITGELGRKTLDTEDPRSRVDTRVLEVLFELDGAPRLPLGLRMDMSL